MLPFRILCILVVSTMTGCLSGRKAGCHSIALSHIEQSYKCLVGLKVKTALEKLRIDTSAVRTFEEPTFLIRGLKITVGDSLLIKLYTKRTRNFPSEETKARSASLPLGVSWRKPKHNKGAYTGKVIIYYENR